MTTHTAIIETIPTNANLPLCVYDTSYSLRRYNDDNRHIINIPIDFITIDNNTMYIERVL